MINYQLSFIFRIDLKIKISSLMMLDFQISHYLSKRIKQKYSCSTQLAFIREPNKKSYRFALNQSENVYKYIVLTHQQKHDIQQHFPISDDQFQLVPHFIELDTEVEQDSSNNQNRFIYIGRFSAEKQIDHIIRAYHKFLQSGYQTELHLFGRDEDNQIPLMNTLISELKLSDKVKIFKYTNQPLQEFKNSKASTYKSI